MSKSNKKKSTEPNQHNFDAMLLEDMNTADDIPIDWLPKNEPITDTMSYKNSDE
ncbi:hypothetical protein [Bacillus sp. AFS002410]|uniref:hypothetical protein n=1 Tax=Bacillus sp. AFS002410 TaxID=2033481 RepID=UPI0015CF67E9|nr:hypothetical protein [Bacillus sp. AFS002410]